MWLGRDPAIIRDPACIAYLIYTAPASKQDPALIWTRLINGHIQYIYIYISYVRPFAPGWVPVNALRANV